MNIIIHFPFNFLPIGVGLSVFVCAQTFAPIKITKIKLEIFTAGFSL